MRLELSAVTSCVNQQMLQEADLEISKEGGEFSDANNLIMMMIMIGIRTQIFLTKVYSNRRAQRQTLLN